MLSLLPYRHNLEKAGYSKNQIDILYSLAEGQRSFLQKSYWLGVITSFTYSGISIAAEISAAKTAVQALRAVSAPSNPLGQVNARAVSEGLSGEMARTRAGPIAAESARTGSVAVAPQNLYGPYYRIDSLEDYARIIESGTLHGRGMGLGASGRPQFPAAQAFSKQHMLGVPEGTDVLEFYTSIKPTSEGPIASGTLGRAPDLEIIASPGISHARMAREDYAVIKIISPRIIKWGR